MSHLFDAHSHLSEARSPEAEGWRVLCGTCEADWQAVLAQSASDRWAIPMLGLHPWFVEEASPEWVSHLESLLRSHRAGVGECGLDFARKESNRAEQESAFRTQLRLAHALHRPVTIHVVRAWGRLLDLLREEGVPEAGAMIHAYGGSLETAQALQSMGVFLSFSGDLLNHGRVNARASLASAHARLLLLETDGTADLQQVIREAAGLREMPAEALAAQTWENGHRCFKELMA